MRLRTFGSIDLRRADGHEIHSVLAQPKRLALLVYLAAAPAGHFHRRDTLLGIFWPELANDRARASLRKAIHLLRQALGEGAIIRRGDDEIGIDHDLIWCDVEALRGALESGDVESALDLYRGPFLEGFFIADAPEFETWSSDMRTHLRESVARGFMRAAERHEQACDNVGAALWARHALALLPQDEQSLRFLLGLLDRVGDRAGAIEAYDTFSRQLTAEYGDEPSAESQRLIEKIRARRPETVATEAVQAVAVALVAPQQPAQPFSSTASDKRKHAGLRAVLLAGALTVLALMAARTVFTSGSAVEQVAAAQVQLPGVVDMNFLPEGFYDYNASVGQLRIGRRFHGQRDSTVDGFTKLGDVAASPLQLTEGSEGHLFQFKPWNKVAVLSAVGTGGVPGHGSLAVRFDHDQSAVAITFGNANHGLAVVQFFRHNGTVIDERVISAVEEREYVFQRHGNRKDIAGFTIQNHDGPNGLSISRIRYDAPAYLRMPGDLQRIVVLPFSQRGGVNAVPIATRVRDDLDGFDHLHVVEDALVRAQTGLSADLNEAGAAKAAIALHAGFYVRGALARTGRQTRIALSLYRWDAPELPVATAQMTGASERASAMTDALTREMLAQMYQVAGRFPAEDACRHARDLTWLRSYMDGEYALLHGNYALAVTRFRAATSSDPASSEAWYRLSQAYFRTRDLDAARAAVERAISTHGGRAREGERELLRLEAWRAYLDRDYRNAWKAYDNLTATPVDADAWRGMAETMMHAGGMHGKTSLEVAAVVKRALRLAPRNPALWFELAQLSAARSRSLAEFLAARAFDGAGAYTPNLPEAEVAAFRDAIRGDSLHETNRLMFEHGDADFAIETVALYTTRLDMAAEIARLHLGDDRSTRARMLSTLAIIEAARGRPRSARAVTDSIAVIDEKLAQSVRALMAQQPFADDSAGNGRYAKDASADALMDAAARFRHARALERAGRLQDALHWLETLPGGQLSAVIFAAPAALERARIAEQLSDTTAAVKNYRRVLRLWSDAEPQLQAIVRSAQSRVDALTSGLRATHASREPSASANSVSMRASRCSISQRSCLS